MKCELLISLSLIFSLLKLPWTVGITSDRVKPCPFPHNGFQYVVTHAKHPWQKCREICRQMGGDLAAIGIRDPKWRKKIARLVPPGNMYTDWFHSKGLWVGASNCDTGSHSTHVGHGHHIHFHTLFKWVDGPMADEKNDFYWYPSMPNRNVNVSCVQVYSVESQHNLKALNRDCEKAYKSLCEIPANCPDEGL